MLVNVSITQVNKSNLVSFEATKQINVGESGGLEDSASEISIFISDLRALIAKNAECGYKNAVNGLKKSLPLVLALSSEEDSLTLKYRNFGKFAETALQPTIEQFLRNNIEFTLKHG